MIILGSSGMLGSAFVKYFKTNCIPLSRDDCDFANFNILGDTLNKFPNLPIINCAAKINISFVEENFDECFKINTLLPEYLAKYCLSQKRKLIHISTDHFYVDSMLLHDEKTPVTLINSYAEQKFIAEKLISYVNKDALIVRTSILGFKGDKENTLIQWILNTLKNEKKINGFEDAITSSIDVGSLCKYVDMCIENDLSGTYNICSKEPYSKYLLIKKCIDLTNSNCLLIEDSVNNLNTKRAFNCGLDPSKIESVLNINMPNLDMILKNLNIKGAYNEI